MSTSKSPDGKWEAIRTLLFELSFNIGIFSIHMYNNFNHLFKMNSTKDHLTLNNKDTNFKILCFKHLLNTTPFFLLHSKVVSFKLAELLGLSMAMKSKMILHVKLK